MIQISPSARQEILRLHSRQHPPTTSVTDVRVRLAIQPSACLTYTYAIAFDTTAHPAEHTFSCNGVNLVIADDHLPLLDGLTLDYSEDLMGGNFRFHNPNAQNVCGCGHSFTV